MPAATAPQQNPSPPSRWRYWWLAGLAAVYSGLVYANALANPYAYDDMRTVQNNPSIESIYAVKRIILRESMRPLVNATYALDRAIWPWELIGHHLTSVLLHVVNVLLLFQLAWVATEDMRRRGASGPSERVSPVIVAFVAAALFGLHPMMTEAVGYISGRSDVLAATCFYATDIHKRGLGKGMNDNSLDRIPELKAEMLMIWGRQDPHVPLEGRQKVHAALQAAGTNFTWHEFNGAHAFLRDEGYRYDPELALTCYQLALALFRRKLGEGDQPVSGIAAATETKH